MCEPYSSSQMYDLLFRIRMEVMNGDKHDANRMLLSLSESIFPGPKNDEVGECDLCGDEYELASRDGRCGDCGNCAKCCVCEAEITCPRCLSGYTGFPALSRTDNKTEICSDCGVAEAMDDFAGVPLRKIGK